MKERKTASRAEFELLADMLTDLAKAEYLSCVELMPKLVVMGLDPLVSGQPGYRFGQVPIAELMTSTAGIPGEVVIAALIERLAQDPEILVVGHVAEAWRAQYTKEAREKLGPVVNPEDAPNREEVLLLNLHSTSCTALMTCKLTREGFATVFQKGDLLFHPRPSESRLGRYTNTTGESHE
jgi:hypothetical protein